MLSDTRCRTAKTDKLEEWLSDGNGLYLRVRQGGTRTWYVRRKSAGKTTRIRVGPYPAITLRQARLKAAELALAREVSSVTVESLVKEWMTDVIERSYRRPDLVRGYLDRAILPALGRRKVRDITRTDLVTLIKDYRQRGTRAADQLRSVLSGLFSFAVEIGCRDDNPATGISRRISDYRQRDRTRVLTDPEIRDLWTQEHPNAGLLRFLLLTGLRISEARNGRYEGTRWIIPAEASKNGRPHWVHLTQSAFDQLPLTATSPTGVQAWLKRWCAREGIDPAYTPHDLRRTFATRAHSLGTAPHVVERVLNHTLQGVMATYNVAEYAPERVVCAEAVERHILEVVSNE